MRPLSKKKQLRRDIYEYGREELFEAQLALKAWFTTYMGELLNNRQSNNHLAITAHGKMISRDDALAWLVSAAPPAKPQFYSGQVDGSSCFSCDWHKGVPLTHAEASKLVVELEHAFSRRAERYEVVYLGDVASRMREEL